MAGCGQTSAKWLPSTMPSPPLNRPNGSGERRSSAFVRRLWMRAAQQASIDMTMHCASIHRAGQWPSRSRGGRESSSIRWRTIMTEERAVLAGGCFWGMQDLFRHHDGVISTRVGYTGGDVPKATYRNHGPHGEA